MDDLIRKLFLSIFIKTEHIELVSAYDGSMKDGSPNSGLDEIKANRAKGTLRKPIVIYGFDSEIRIRQHKSGSILDAPGVFYVRLPALMSDIRVVIEKATNARIPEDLAIDEKSFRDYAFREIRDFKHRCDNLWTSMEMNANRARMALDNSPGTIPSALLEFKTSKVQKLVNEYTELGARSKQLGITGSEKVKGILDEVVEIVKQIQDGKTLPYEGVNLAFQCVKKVQAVSSILEKAKELE